MSDHQRTISIPIPAEEAFRFLSNVSNLPMFLPHMKALKEDKKDHVSGVVELDGNRQEMSGSFRADTAKRRLDWVSDGASGYRGSLQIVPRGAHDSRITVHISLNAQTASGLTDEKIEREFDGVLSRLVKVLEEQHATLAA
jgi:uncharacterized membrane protein